MGTYAVADTVQMFEKQRPYSFCHAHAVLPGLPGLIRCNADKWRRQWRIRHILASS